MMPNLRLLETQEQRRAAIVGDDPALRLATWELMEAIRWRDIWLRAMAAVPPGAEGLQTARGTMGTIRQIMRGHALRSRRAFDGQLLPAL